MKFHVACVLALTVWGTQTSAAIMDRCASPSEEEFAQIAPSGTAVQDFASELKAKAAPIIAASVAKEEEIAREKRATEQAEWERRQAILQAERAAEKARKQKEWEASRPEREARAREEERIRARNREFDRIEARQRAQQAEAAMDALRRGLESLAGANSGAQGGSPAHGDECWDGCTK